MRDIKERYKREIKKRDIKELYLRRRLFGRGGAQGLWQ